ncbi:MAG: hypothetical protein GY711_33155, partial [bacterium]|nr:hypothetical protein [bacterium]
MTGAPVEGALTPWDDGVATAGFDGGSEFVSGLSTSVPNYDATDRLVVSSYLADDERGWVVLQPARWEDDAVLGDAQLRAEGADAQDYAGAALDFIALPGFDTDHLVIGAPGVDE